MEDLVLQNIMETPVCFFSKIGARMLTEDYQCACGVCLHPMKKERGDEGKEKEGKGKRENEKMYESLARLQR